MKFRITNNITLATLIAGFIAGWDASGSFFIFPDIRDTLANGDAISASWVLSMTNIVGAALLLQSGRFSDKYGPGPIFRLGIYTFLAGSVLSVLAPSIWVLVGARSVTAAGQALMGPAGIAILLQSAKPGTEAKTIGRWGLFTGVGGVISSVLVSQLIDSYGWRGIFILQIPIGLLVIVLLYKTPKFSYKNSSVVIVPIFSILTTVGLVLLILPIVKIATWGWGSIKTLLCLFFAFAILTWLLKRSGSQVSSPIPTHLFRNRSFYLSGVISLFAAIIFYAQWLAPLLLITEVWGFGLVKAALILTIMPATFSLLSVFMGKRVDQHGPKFVMIPGISLYILFFFIFWMFADGNESVFLLTVTLLAAGAAMASVWPTLTAIATSAIPPDDLSSGTAAIHTIQRIGGALGVALVLAVISSTSDLGLLASHKASLLIMPIGAVISLIAILMLPSHRSS
ncbi:MAG: MFS transporter [Acidimicrobiales bacterium]|nr:MFS transporter [Acidimicrobiales bacterium]